MNVTDQCCFRDPAETGLLYHGTIPDFGRRWGPPGWMQTGSSRPSQRRETPEVRPWHWHRGRDHWRTQAGHQRPWGVGNEQGERDGEPPCKHDDNDDEVGRHQGEGDYRQGAGERRDDKRPAEEDCQGDQGGRKGGTWCTRRRERGWARRWRVGERG